jgi:hypothetical protein
MKNIYSIFSGTFYEVLDEDVTILDIGQLPLIKNPNKNCSKCYGRGHTGRNFENLTYSVCNCVKKVIDYALTKNEEQKD